MTTELYAQIEVIKRLLRYVRREHSLKRSKMLDMINNHQQGAIFNNLQGQVDAYQQFIGYYEKILKEYEQALEEAKARDSVVTNNNMVADKLSEEVREP